MIFFFFIVSNPGFSARSDSPEAGITYLYPDNNPSKFNHFNTEYFISCIIFGY